MAEHAPLARPAPSGLESRRRPNLPAAGVGPPHPAAAQLAARGELAQRNPAARAAAVMGERLATRGPAELEPDPTGLGHELRSGLEALSGRDLSSVRVHYDSPKPAQLNAKAYTQLPHIYVAPGEESNVPHEGWHAAQQMADTIRPTLDVAGTPVNDDPRLEREADVMGQRALAVQRKARGGLRTGAVSAAPVAQRVIRLADDADKRLAEALASLVGEPVVTEVEASPRVVLIANSADRQTESWTKTARGRQRFEDAAALHTTRPQDVDFLVTINNGELDGLEVDPLRSFDPRTFETPPQTTGPRARPDLNRSVAEAIGNAQLIEQGVRLPPSGRSSTTRETAPEFGLLPFLESTGLQLPPELELSLLARDSGSFQPTSLVSLFDFAPLDFQALEPAKTRLGASTVLLHELGHVSRDLAMIPETLRGDVDERLQAPNIDLFLDPGILQAVLLGHLESPYWPAIRAKLNALTRWIDQAKKNLADAPPTFEPAPPSQEAATAIEHLIARTQLEVGLWLEFDVIANIEHPRAAAENEPIRTFHGEERELGDDPLPPLEDLIRPPRNLEQVQERMVTKAKTLAGGLPVTLVEIWTRYQAYRPKALASLAVLIE